MEAEASTLAPEPLAARLTQLGLIATVNAPDGATYQSNPPSPILGNPPAGGGTAGALAMRPVALPGGGTVNVYARRAGIDEALSRLLFLELAGTTLAIGLAAVLLWRLSGVALRPIEHMAAVARRTAGGSRGERLHPDRPDTPIGRLAVAYDDMLDALETALVEAREAEGRSQCLEQRSRQILETSTDGFVAMDADGRITDWNGEAERIFGRSKADVLGCRVSDTIVPPELRDAHQAGLNRFLASGEGRLLGRRLRLPALHVTGRRVPVELAVWATSDDGHPTFNALVHDISERQEAEEALYRLAAIVESAEEAIIGMRLDGTVFSWNRGAEQIYGYRADEVVGRHVSLIVPMERSHELDAFLERVRSGRSVARHETVRRTKNGTLVDVALSMSPVRDAGGAVIGISTVARDVTEQHWMSSTLDATLSELEIALDQARRSEARSRAFLANAAHQLRTPIAGIRACSEALLRGAPRAERDTLLAAIARETARASRLMTGLLQMARLDQGEPLAPKRCDVVALCADEVERARSLAPHLQIAKSTTGLTEQPELDAGAVREVVANLLDNARRHARSHVEVAVVATDGMVEIRVIDDGPGLEESMVERAFERFASLDGKGGSGLGLPIARGLAQAHGGDVVYEGGRFVVRLPMRATLDGRLKLVTP